MFNKIKQYERDTFELPSAKANGFLIHRKQLDKIRGTIPSLTFAPKA